MSLGQGDIGADVLINQVLNGIVYDYVYHFTLHISTCKVYTENEVIHVHSHCVDHYNKVGSHEKASVNAY